MPAHLLYLTDPADHYRRPAVLHVLDPQRPEVDWDAWRALYNHTRRGITKTEVEDKLDNSWTCTVTVLCERRLLRVFRIS